MASLLTLGLLTPCGPVTVRRYTAGSSRLFALLAAVIAVAWIQQALTFRYIRLRPELTRLLKYRSQKYRLCGKVYSKLNPRNPANWIYLSVIFSEFFVLASV